MSFSCSVIKTKMFKQWNRVEWKLTQNLFARRSLWFSVYNRDFFTCLFARSFRADITSRFTLNRYSFETPFQNFIRSLVFILCNRLIFVLFFQYFWCGQSLSWRTRLTERSFNFFRLGIPNNWVLTFGIFGKAKGQTCCLIFVWIGNNSSKRIENSFWIVRLKINGFIVRPHEQRTGVLSQCPPKIEKVNVGPCQWHWFGRWFRFFACWRWIRITDHCKR